jgi:hypothetical protein
MEVNGLFHAPTALLRFKEPPSTYCKVRCTGPITDLDVVFKGRIPNKACLR